MALNKETYTELIKEDMEQVERYFPEHSCVKTHIQQVLKESISCYYPSEGEKQPDTESKCNKHIVNGSYSIDFGGDCKAKIQITNGEPKVEAAMNGWGNGISLSDITIEKL